MNLNKALIGDLLHEKGGTVYCIAANSTVKVAVTEMNLWRIGSLMVTDSGHVVGILTERDVLTRVIAVDLDPKLTPVSRVMTMKFKFITSDASVEDAMQRMREYRIRHLPVFDGDQLLGMLSISDINSWLLKVNEMEAESLRRYMFETYPC